MMNNPAKKSMARHSVTMRSVACAMTGTHEERVALTDVSISAALRDLLAEVIVSQTYRNDERVNIEAVYTFPLPLDAVLLELQVEIGGRVLTGVVVGKQAAEETYEDAVGSGDAAFMLQEIEPGLYTMNVGNLLPGEQATITFTYAMLYRWTGDRLRFFLPTTVAPRYGESPHLPHQIPEASLTVENQFSLQVEIFGSLREAQFTCPSHEVKHETFADKVVISLQQAQAVMDRDFILNIKAPQATRSFVQCGVDGEGMAAVASFQPFFPGLQQPRPLNLAIVIDCSGSMQGDSMEQARQALKGILDALQAHDRVTLIAFGNTTSALSDRLLPCNKSNLARARSFAKKLDANMGGTEIGNALQAAYAAVEGAASADIFLVTDGEVSSWKDVVQQAGRSGHRIFTVGVGSAVSEAFVRGLADATGGECELVAPREGMADRVIRHFERMRSPRSKRVNIHWPEGARDLAPATVGAVFEGDTVTLSARFDHPLSSGAVVLEVETEEGENWRHELPLPMPPLSESANGLSTVARLAASSRIGELDPGPGLETALRYRLVSPWTNWLVIAERAEEDKAQDMPALRKVPQTLAAGWGGTGDVLSCMRVDRLQEPAPRFSRSLSGSEVQMCSMEYLDTVAFSASIEADPEDDELLQALRPNIPEPFRRLFALIEAEPGRLEARHALRLLRDAGLNGEFEELFQHAASVGLNVEVIAAIVLARLLDGSLDTYLPDETRRAVKMLQIHAAEASHIIQEIGHRANEFLGVVYSGFGREILQRDVAEPLERITRLHGFLAQLEDYVRHVQSRALIDPLLAFPAKPSHAGKPK